MRKQVGFWKLDLVPPLCHLGSRFVSLGTPWGTMGSAGTTRWVPETDFIDSGMILGAYFERFLGLDESNYVFLLGLVSRLLFASILSRIIDSWSFENKGFVKKVLNKLSFCKNRFLVIRGSICGGFWTPWEQVF